MFVFQLIFRLFKIYQGCGFSPYYLLSLYFFYPCTCTLAYPWWVDSLEYQYAVSQYYIQSKHPT